MLIPVGTLDQKFQVIDKDKNGIVTIHDVLGVVRILKNMKIEIRTTHIQGKLVEMIPLFIVNILANLNLIQDFLFFK